MATILVIDEEHGGGSRPGGHPDAKEGTTPLYFKAVP